MASAEQPLKKRKLYESLPEPPPPQQPPPPAKLSKSLPQSFAAPPLSQEEILRRRRNREEIRSVYDCYKQIKFCISQKDPRLMPDLEQTYLSLITASRGCSSVQRIVADFIPRYASYCPTALEAAVKVTINMHNWSLAVINRGEDADGVAFGTAKACIFGLADICRTASSQAPTSSVIQGICSAVFFNVLTFLISSFEGKDIFQIVDKEALKIQGSTEIFSKLKEKFSDEDESALAKLSKFRALCLLRIFFCCPGNSLAACFEFFDSTAPEGAQKEGRHLLHQVTSSFNIDNVAHCLNNSVNESKSSTEGIDLVSKDEVSSPVLRNCLLGLVLGKDPSLRKWLFSKYNKFCKSASSEVFSEVTSILEGIFESFTDLVKVEDTQVDSDKDDSNSSKYVNKQYLVPGMNQHENSYEDSGRDCTSKLHDGSYNDDLADKFSSQYLKHHRSLVTLESDPSNTSSSYDSGGSKLVSLDTGEHGDLSRCRSSTPRDILNSQLPSPITRKPFDFRTNSFERRNHFGQLEKNQVLPTSMSSIGVVNSAFESPRCHQTVPHPSTIDQIFWYSDGDSAAMDVFSASKQLWLGSLGPDASEALVRFQFEKFGPIEQFLYFPSKGFALVEYRYIMDAIKAREVMRGQSPWGACLRIKFLDIGLGTRGIVNAVAVGSSCLVYIGNIWSQWAKDEILQDLIKVFYKGPRMVTDLTSEGALLLKFETPEEAASVIAHLRQQRKGKNHPLKSNVAPANVTRLIDLTRSGPASIHGDFRSNKVGKNIVESPHGQTVLESPTEGYSMRMSRLASLLSSLRSKYNITHNSNYIDNQMSADSMRDEDRLPTSTLWINIPNVSSPFLTDDELMAICDLAIGTAGSVVRLTRANMQMGACWFVECSSLDAAHALLKTLRICPMNLFQIEFSQSGKLQAAPFTTKPESSATELPIPRLNSENHGTTVQSGHAFQSNWTAFGCAGTHEAGARKIDTYDNTMVANSLNGGGHVVSGTTEQMWMYNKSEPVVHSAPGNIPCMPTPYQGPIMPPPQPFPSTPFMRPVYFPPNSSWEAHSLGHHQPLNPISSGVIPNNPHSNSVPAPFLPASVTPLAQMQGSSLQHSNQMFPLPVVPPPIASLPPPQPDMPPPLPPSPPPLPQHQPPLVPPPPSSPPPPPPPPPVESSHLESSGQYLHYQWQGALSKSGVHYCTIYAQRVDSNACMYSNAISEPAEWPAKLDMTKRTDFRHVMSTFSGTPPHKREVCRLFPSSQGDRKGFQDFISYLKQRECAGVIKIPAAKSMWARLLFILPYSMDACSMLSIAPNPSDCLIALILPKETNFEWV